MPKLSPAQVSKDLHKITEFFKLHHLDYMLIGGLALSIWGRPRVTLDLDFLVLVHEEDMRKLAAWSEEEGFKIDKNWMKWNPLLKGSQLRLRAGNVSVDLMVPRDEHDRRAFERKRRKKLGKAIYQVIAPEDFVLQKLKVGRPRDFEDATTVIQRLQGKLRVKYLREWAKRLGILDELNYIVNL